MNKLELGSCGFRALNRISYIHKIGALTIMMPHCITSPFANRCSYSMEASEAVIQVIYNTNNPQAPPQFYQCADVMIKKPKKN